MKRILFYFFPLFISVNFLAAQTLDDAVRYSLLEVGGTARTVGIGGAISALGADFSSLSTNPAGLATFRRSEFTFTPAFERYTIDAKLNEKGDNFSSERDKTNFNINNLGLVFVSRPLDASWRNTAFGIGLNRRANYRQSFYFEGRSNGSITDRWLELVQGLTPSELDGFEAGPAFDAYAIFNPSPDDNTFYQSDFVDQQGFQDTNIVVKRSQLVQRKGSMTELVFSFAGNYEDRIMIGATLGVPIFSFEETKTYNEVNEPLDSSILFDALTYTERLRTTGAGVNLKVGIIYRVNQMIRLGAAIHSPTGLGLDDNFTTELDYRYTDGGVSQQNSAQSPDGTFQYRIRTPWRFIGSAGFIFGKYGFVSGEVEWVDYSSAKFNFNNTDNSGDLQYEQELNNQIKDNLQGGVNIRIGGEYAFDIFRIRGGYSWAASPYTDGNDPVSAFSLGAGIRWQAFFMDFAFRRFLADRDYLPYRTNTAPQQLVSLEAQRNQLMLTLGFKF
ncbi:MAG: hypothetical protein H6577_06520 [Lewinellaceae bacterium]|nr:hypothetical protein [Saprospiraceae bacterium]MCB9337762.1 hypothetical protein [Lewinellaceae bacterium]